MANETKPETFSDAILKEMAGLQEQKEDRRTESLNAIVYGALGSGKTHLLRTCRRPILIDSFDPGGTKTLRDDPGYMNGEIIVDTSFEVDDPKNPTAMKSWDEKFHNRRRMGLFNSLGTYVIDSATTWSEAVMNFVLKAAGRPNQNPQQPDWLTQMNLIKNAMQGFCALPCDCILTGHINFDKDEASGRLIGGIMLTGKLKTRIPLLFDEIYCAQAQADSKGQKYTLLTRSNSLLEARTRIGGGKFEQFEEPNIKALLRKAGMSDHDLPPIK